MKVVLMQLPVPSFETDYPSENIPLGPAYLAAYARERNPDAHLVLAPPHVANAAGDTALLAWLEAERPDVVGLACYVWNVERSIHLAARIKQIRPETMVVLGGPEVNPDNTFLLGHPVFDFGVVGEGEETFSQWLQAVLQNGSDPARIPGLLFRRGDRWVTTAPRPPLTSLDAIPSPYLTGILGPSAANTVILETLRGCPYRCAYCYYHKSYPHPRPFALDRVRRELLWAAERGVEEVYFLDPCFARRPNLEALIRAMEEARSIFPIRFQAELNAEDATDALIAALARAGLEQVEVGLQSINPKALKAIGRRFDPDRFLEAVRRLRREGIGVMVDLMVGLPFDTVEDVKRAVDFVVEHDLFDELSLYPLSLLPGTVLRRKAPELGIQYLAEPPYYVLQTPHMVPDDVRHAFEYAEQATGIDFFPVEVPQAALEPDDRHPPPHGTRVVLGRHPAVAALSREAAQQGAAPAAPADLPGNVLIVELESCDALRAHPGNALLETLRANPHTMVTLVVDEDRLDWEAIEDWADRLLAVRSHLMDRDYFSTLDPIRSVQLLVRFAQAEGPPVLVRLPLRPREKEASVPSAGHFLDTARQAWVGFPPDLDQDEEDALLERIWKRLPPHIQRLRLAELG
ncbi:Radical SAM superfamily enzyme YgiQ, UPF0313 family [Desulfacinum hydrothermale DSM 13146]|uniref:Radical SAM superfamily enzyme YgiQ, UPF0313 family n=1 Tax=Desulfacinum hydrothermale DSM 13146 TaxID=1121390 RepID=A0A1W1XVJ2_9BACT|nr:radical SAM protein [Desulfacinum hydrothermale]SMC28010.1 Radical SAM superfamily enzyme YgiQ, UPF0313 family [Desulfacinum hydrothermale DSM 13146]